MAKQTWIYLMRDMRNGFIKIGKSKNPVYRERTLQSEQPQIELIEAWQAESTVEPEMHKCFAAKRIRGEWFDLTEEQVCDIENYFFYHTKFSTGRSGEQEEEHRRYMQEMRATEFADKANWLDFATEAFGYDF